MTTSNERQVWINGAFVPESQAMVSVRDLGLVYGDGVFDTARTFHGQLFRAKEHVTRLYDSLAYCRIPAPMPAADMLALTEALVARNRAVLREGEDYWVTQRVTMGLNDLDGEAPVRDGPTAFIECTPLPLRARARYFRDGIPALIAARPKIAPEALSPRAKTTTYLNMSLAGREVAAIRPGAWALMRDAAGHIAEGAGCNVFFVAGGVVYTPARDFVLAGISRQVVMDLCADLQITCVEGTVPDALALTADEAFFTSTSLCICPLASLDAQSYPVPGPMTARLMAGFNDLVGMDFAAQYLRFLSDRPASVGL